MLTCTTFLAWWTGDLYTGILSVFNEAFETNLPVVNRALAILSPRCSAFHIQGYILHLKCCGYYLPHWWCLPGVLRGHRMVCSEQVVISSARNSMRSMNVFRKEKPCGTITASLFPLTFYELDFTVTYISMQTKVLTFADRIIKLGHSCLYISLFWTPSLSLLHFLKSTWLLTIDALLSSLIYTITPSK